MRSVSIIHSFFYFQADAFYKLLNPEAEKPFISSSGYQWRFCNRYGIRNLSIAGEKLHANRDAAEEFKTDFPGLIDSYDLNQIFNCDETGLCYRLLPKKTLASACETKADGGKKAKDRIMVNACANIAGEIKMPLLFIGKAKKPRCFRGINVDGLPVVYRNQKNAWVDSNIFYEWFHDFFAPYAREKLVQMGLEPKALLILENCSAHPEIAELTTADGMISAIFLPANVTSLIQPMDQGVLESMKRVYRKQLLRDLINKEDTEMFPFLKQLNMLDVIERIATAWDYVSQATIRKSRRKLVPIREENVDENNDVTVSNNELLGGLRALDIDVVENDIDEWFACDGPGYEHMNDTGIVDLVTNIEIENEESDDEPEIVEGPVPCPVTHAAAMQAFDQCLTWLRHQNESTAINTAMLLQLRELSAEKREFSRKQTSIDSFFGRL